MSRRRLFTLRELAAEVAFVLRMRAAERRFRQHAKACERYKRAAAWAAEGMVREIEVRKALCTRRGDRPGSVAPRTGSGVPVIPRASRQEAGSA